MTLLLLLLAPPAAASAPDWVAEAYSVDAAGAAPDGALPMSRAPWWPAFGDPGLTATVERSLAANPDLLAVDALADQSRALAAQGAAAVLPALSFDVQGQLAPYDSLGFGFGLSSGGAGGDTPEMYGSGSAKLNGSLRVDLWGRSLTTWRASRLDALAAAGDRDARALVLSTTVAGAWLDAATAARQLAVVEEQRRVAGELADIVRLRYEGGAAGALDLIQQEQQLAALDAQLPLSRAQLRLARQRLAVLQGLDPSGALPEPAAALPALPARPALGSPADLVDSRPDVRAAAVRADAAGARRSAAIRGLLPTLALSGSAGWQAMVVDEWAVQETWGAGASLSVPLFNGGSTHAAIRASAAAREAAVRQLESALRGAVQEVEGALVQEGEQAARLAATVVQRERAEAAWSVAREGYSAGFVDYLQLQSAQSSLLTARLAEIGAEREVLGARLQLHQALGGTWTTDLDAIRARAPGGATP